MTAIEPTGCPFALIAYPIAGNSDEELRDKAEVAVQVLVPLLTQRAPTTWAVPWRAAPRESSHCASRAAGAAPRGLAQALHDMIRREVSMQ